nr:signal peptidase I [Acinetobacter qingfengensis]
MLDKLVFKQNTQLKQKKQAVVQADQQVIQAQQHFEQLKAKYPEKVIADSVPQADDPAEIIQARDQLGQIKVRAAQAHNDLNVHKTNPLINWAYDFWPVLAVVLVLRSFFYEPFNIPSESMNPTLETGDFILVQKYAYGIRLPLLNNKIIHTSEPENGDVIVFRYPENPSISYIKRVIGVPGDKIVFQNGVLYINGEKQPYQLGSQVSLPVKLESVSGQAESINVQAQQWVVNIGQHRFLTQYIKPEQTAVDAQQYIQNYQAQSSLPLSLNQNWQVTVPQGQYFAMGDNRDQSADSRYWGFVPEANLTGKATYIWMHKDPGLHLPSFKRNGSIP